MPRHKHNRKSIVAKKQKAQNQISQLQEQIRKLKEENKDLNRQIDFGHHFATSSDVPALRETSKIITVDSTIETDDEKTQSPTHQLEESAIPTDKKQSIQSVSEEHRAESRTMLLQNRIALLERCKTLDQQGNKLMKLEAAVREKEADLEMAREELNVSIRGAQRTLLGERQEYECKVQKLIEERTAFEANKMKFAVGVSTICAALGCVGYAASRR